MGETQSKGVSPSLVSAAYDMELPAKHPSLESLVRGNLEAIAKYLRRPKKLLKVDERGDTILHKAAAFGAVEIVAALLKKNAELALIENLDGLTPFHLAAQYGKLECARLLLDLHPKLVNVPFSKNPANFDYSLIERSGKIVWSIANFSKIEEKKVYSDPFQLGGSKWRLVIYPRGSKGDDNLSLYLEVANHEKLADGWSYLVSFTFGIVNQLTGVAKIVREVPAHRFYKTHTDLGFPQMVKKSSLNSKKTGILHKDRLQVALSLKTLDASTFGLDEQFGAYTCRLNGFSKAKDQRMITPPFYIAGVPWTLAVYPKGKTLNQSLSIYLKILPPSPQHAHYTSTPTATTSARDRDKDTTHDEPANEHGDPNQPTSSSPPSLATSTGSVVGAVNSVPLRSSMRASGASTDDSDSWSYVVNFRISLLNQLDGSKFTRSVDAKVFKHNFIDWGFPQFIKLSTLLSPDSGFLDDDAIVLEVVLEVVECIRPRSAIYTPHLITTMPSTPTHINLKQGQSGGPSLSSSSLTSSMSMSATHAGSSAAPGNGLPFHGYGLNWNSLLANGDASGSYYFDCQPHFGSSHLSPPTESTSQSTVVSIGSQYLSIFSSKARRPIAMRGYKKGTILSIDSPIRPLLFTPLHWAVFSGSLEAVSELLARQADVDAVDVSGRTSLDWACYCGHFDVAKLLLAKGASCRSRDAEHAKPVHKAAYLGSPDVIQLMLHHYQNVEADLAPIEKRRRNFVTNTADYLVEAQSSQHHHHTKRSSSDSKDDIISVIYPDTGPDMSPESPRHIKDHIKDSSSTHTHHSGSHTTIHSVLSPRLNASASANNRSSSELTSTLLSDGLQEAVDPSATVSLAPMPASQSIPINTPSSQHPSSNDFSSSPSTVFPSSTSPSQGYMSSSPQMPSNHSEKSVHNRQSSGEKEGSTPDKISGGTNTTIVPLAVYTPLQFSLKSGRSSLAEQLVEDFDCSVNCVDVWGRTPLHMAAFTGDIKLLELFLSRSHPSLVNYQDRDGFTPLHKAIPRGYFDCVQVLLNAGSDVGLRSKSGHTPFHYAVLLNELQCAKLILEFDRRRGTAPVPLRVDMDSTRRSSDVVETDIPSIVERKRATVQISEVIQLVAPAVPGVPVAVPNAPHSVASNNHNTAHPISSTSNSNGTVNGPERSTDRRAPVVGILHHPPGSEAALARQMQRMKQLRGNASDEELFEMKDAASDGEELSKIPTRTRTVGFHAENAVLRMKTHATQANLDNSADASITDSVTSLLLPGSVPTSSSAPPFTSGSSATSATSSKSKNPASDSDPDSSSSSDSSKDGALSAGLTTYSGVSCGHGTTSAGNGTDDDGALSADSEDDDDAEVYEEAKPSVSTRSIGRRRANTSTGVGGRRRLTFMSDGEYDGRGISFEHEEDVIAAIRDYTGDEVEGDIDNEEPEESSESISAAAAAAIALRNDRLRMRERENDYYYYRGRSMTRIEPRSNSGPRSLLRTRSSSPPNTHMPEVRSRQRSSSSYYRNEGIETSNSDLPADVAQESLASTMNDAKDSSSSRKSMYVSSRSKSTGTFKTEALDRGSTPSTSTGTVHSSTHSSSSHSTTETTSKSRPNKLSGLLRAFSQKTSDVLTGASSTNPSSQSSAASPIAVNSIGHVTIASSDPENESKHSSRPRGDKVRRSSSSSSLDTGRPSQAIRPRRGTGVAIDANSNASLISGTTSSTVSPPLSPMNAPSKAKFSLPPSTALSSSTGSNGTSKVADGSSATGTSANTSNGSTSARSRKGRSPPPSGTSRRPKSGSISTIDRDHALSSVVSPRTNSPRHALVHSTGSTKSSAIGNEEGNSTLTVGESLRSNVHSKSPSDGSSVENRASELHYSTSSKHKERDRDREKEKEKDREKRDSDGSSADKISEKHGSDKLNDKVSKKERTITTDLNGEKSERSERSSTVESYPSSNTNASNYSQLSASAPLAANQTNLNGSTAVTNPSSTGTSGTGTSSSHSSPPTSTGSVSTKKRSKSTRGTKSDLKVQINLPAVPASTPTSPVGGIGANPLSTSITPRSSAKESKESKESEKMIPCPPTYTPAEILRTPDINGWLPLHTCVKQGNLKMVEYVLEYGASVTDLANGVSVLDLAIQNMDSTLTTLLLERGAPIADGGMALQSFISQKVISSRSSYAEGAPIPPSTLLGDMRSLLNNSQFYDVTFVVEGKHVFGWRGLLATRCEVFRAMFTGSLRESSETHVPITDVSYNTFYRIIEFIYTDSVTSDKMTLDDALQLLAAANRYLLDRLKRIVERWLLSQLTDSNVAAIFHAADLHQAHALRSACILYVSANCHRISGSYDLLNSTFKSVLLHMLKHPSSITY